MLHVLSKFAVNPRWRQNGKIASRIYNKAKIKNIKISGFRTYGFFSCSNARFHTLNGELSSFAKRNLDKWEKLRSISSLSVLAISLLITTVKSLLIYCVCIWHFKRLTVWLRDRWRPPFCFYSSQAAQEQYSMLTSKNMQISYNLASFSLQQWLHISKLHMSKYFTSK